MYSVYFTNKSGKVVETTGFLTLKHARMDAETQSLFGGLRFGTAAWAASSR